MLLVYILVYNYYTIRVLFLFLCNLLPFLFLIITSFSHSLLLFFAILLIIFFFSPPIFFSSPPFFISPFPCHHCPFHPPSPPPPPILFIVILLHDLMLLLLFSSSASLTANEKVSSRKRRLQEVLDLCLPRGVRSSGAVRVSNFDGCEWGQIEPASYDKVQFATLL